MLTYRSVHMLCLLLVAMALRAAISFTTPAVLKKMFIDKTIATCTTLSQSYDDWDMEEESPDIDDMRDTLEISWNEKTMGTVPNSPERAAEAAAESVAAAMRKSHNVLMIDLRISSYVITEGNEYDKKAMYDFCTNLTTELRARKLITKSLILVRNEKERVDTERAIADARNAATVVPNEEEEVAKESDDIAEFRKKLISSWDSPANPESNAQSESSDQSANLGSSHRLWSMVADEKISSGPNMFDEVIAAVDKHARLRVEKHEDALIIVSPYDTADTIAIRRILARYGQTRTIIIVNSHMEELPTEMDNAVLVYGMMPLEARPLSGTKYENEDESSFKVVIMRRFPKDWSIFVDNNDSGFVQANGSMYDQPRADSKEFPSPEWVRRTIQDYVDDLSQ